jgi:hypothetical protein
MTEERFKKLGVVKQKDLTNNFDEIYEVYKLKALEAGYRGELRFIKEHGKVLIYIVI